MQSVKGGQTGRTEVMAADLLIVKFVLEILLDSGRELVLFFDSKAHGDRSTQEDD